MLRFSSRLALVSALWTGLANGAEPPRRILDVSDLRATPPIEGTPVSGLTWVPGRSRVAFLVQQGTEEPVTADLFVEEVGTGARERLIEGKSLATPGAANASHASLQGYQWAPDGSSLLLSGEPGLFLYDLRGGKLERLTADSVEFPSFSPDGKAVAFVRQGNLFAIDLTTRKESELTRDGGAHVFNGRLDWVYEEELSNHGGRVYEWSPDGRLLAFLRLDENRVPSYPLVDLLSIPHAGLEQQRYPNPGDLNSVPSIHVVDLDGKERAHVEFQPTDDLYVVPEFSWLPDSRSVAYEILNREQTRLDVRLLEIGTGRTTPLLEEHDPYWLNVPDRINSSKRGSSLHFLKGGRFLWLSERSGFNHLYVGSLSKSDLKPLTKGDWMVDSVVGVDEGAGVVYFTSTAKDPRERQIDRVRLDGSGFGPVTSEPGAHSGALSPDGAYLLDTFSTVEAPKAVRLLSTSGKLLRVLDSPKTRLSEFQLPKKEFVELHASDGTRLYGQLMKPADFDPKKTYPVVVYVYGGPHVQIVRNEFPRLGTIEVLASRGYLVWALDNRGSWGRGHAFESPIFKDMGRVELADQLEGVKYLKSLPYVDPARIGITGWSYGGYMTLFAMTHAPEVWKCGVAGAPVSDWRLYDTIYTERYMRTPQSNAEGYKSSSPLLAASKIRGRLLLLHGTGDDNVHMYNTVNFVRELIKAGISYELQIGPGEKHGFREKTIQDARDRAVVAFFEKNL
jgi:dipeptidyl-peptidase-4